MSVSCPSNSHLAARGTAVGEPGRVWFGRGRLHTLGKFLAERDVTSCLVVSGGNSFRTCGAEARLERALGRLRVVHHGGVPPNPPGEYVTEGVAALRESDVDAVVAVGGGSVLDAGKLIAALCAQPGPAENYLTGVRPFTAPRRHVLVLVPTTGGSGSEATSIAVVTVDGCKNSLQHEVLLGDLSIVDPELTWASPPGLTASSGLDALSHAVESYWSVAGTEAARASAAVAIRLVVRYLVAASTAPTAEAREAMSRAALLAGQAIETTQTTAPHALSYPMTMRYSVPHGHACALFLGAFLTYNAAVTGGDVNDPRGPSFVRSRIAEVRGLLGVAAPEEGRAFVGELLGRVGLPHRLADLGVRACDLPWIADAGLRSARMANNPRRVDRETLLDVLAGLLLPHNPGEG